MGRSAAKKIQRLDDLHPGEQVLDACYGLGTAMLAAADAASAGLLAGQAPPGAAQTSASTSYAADTASHGAGTSPLFRTNGIVALTGSRLLWAPVKTALFPPKGVEAAVPLEDVVSVSYERPNLVFAFADGVRAALHVPRAQGPEDFVQAFTKLKGA